MDTVRDAPVGQVIRWITKNKVLQYPEEKPDFQCPSCYSDPGFGADPEKPVIPEEDENFRNLSVPNTAHTSDTGRDSTHGILSGDPEKVSVLGFQCQALY